MNIFKKLIPLVIFAILPLQASANSFWGHKVNGVFNIAYGDKAAQKLDIYQQGQWTGPPEYFVADKTPKPTLIYIHGGAWHGGKKENVLPFLVHYLAKGYQVVNIEYTLGSNTAPAAAEDVLKAIQWLTNNSAKYAIDLSNLVISGDSAGGHLALVAGLITHENKSEQFPLSQPVNVRAIINWFGITDLLALDKYLAQENNWNYARKWAGSTAKLNQISAQYSPINQVSQHSPAILSIHGDIDKVVPYQQAKRLHQKLSALNVEHQLVTLKNGKHLGFTDQQFQHSYQTIFNFLENKVNFPAK